MDAVQDRERTVLFGVLTGLTLVATIALAVLRAHLLVPAWLLFAIGVPYLLLSIVLRIHRDDWGREGRYVDLWSIPHVIGGVLLGVLGIGFMWVLALTVWWECVESASRVFEHFTNRVTDVVIAVAGWAAAQYLLTGGFALG